MNTLRSIASAVCFLALVATARAEVKTKTVTYNHDGTTMKGYLAWDAAATGKRPGVLVVPEWWGLNEYAKKRAEQLAGLGYVAFAADMYGEGKVVEQPKDAAMLAGGARKNPKVWEGRARAALKVLENSEHVDAGKLASIGYCFGGSTSMMLANVGAPVKAVVSFHGAPTPPTPEQAKSIKAKILICHGAADSNIPEEAVAKLKAAYEAGNVSCTVLSFPGVRHSFTVPGAEARGIENLRYDAEADRRSWAAMLELFRETLGK